MSRMCISKREAPQSVPESDLYLPVKRYFESRGFRVRGEVGDCDLAAVLDRNLVAVELKSRLELRLLEQAVERQRSADLVYVAVPLRAMAGKAKRRRQQERLVRRLELGLITVNAAGEAEAVFHPERYRPPKRRSSRSKLLKEIRSRTHDANVGGTTRRARMTAYREQALEIAWFLAESGEASPRALRESGATARTGDILRRNYYGWFCRIDHGVYTLTDGGKQALEEYPEFIAEFERRAESS